MVSTVEGARIGWQVLPLEAEKPRVDSVFLVYHQVRTNLLRGIPGLSNSNVLDLACGSGFPGRYLRDEMGIRTLHSGDLNPTEVSMAKKILERGAVQFDMRALPYSNESFGLVTMWEALEHTSQAAEALDEVNRVLKPGGYLALSTPNGDCLNQRSKRVLRSTGTLGTRIAGQERSDHVGVLNLNQLQETLDKTGFKIIRTIPSGLLPPGFWHLKEHLPDQLAGILAQIYSDSGRLVPGLAAENYLLCQKRQ